MLVFQEKNKKKLKEESPHMNCSKEWLRDTLYKYSKAFIFKQIELQYAGGMCCADIYGDFTVSTASSVFLDFWKGGKDKILTPFKTIKGVKIYKEYIYIIQGGGIPDVFLFFKTDQMYYLFNPNGAC